MKRILMIFAATAAIVSCRKGEELTQPQAPEVTITAEHLKTVIDDKGSVTWDGDEMISVLFSHTNGEDFHIETYENENKAGATAKFVGTIKSHVKTSSGWDDAAYCVCPSSSVNNTGKVEHVLPAEQYAHASVAGSFDTGLNLSYAKLSLEKLEEKRQDAVMFQNALSVLRLVPGSGDITSITINGSAPLAGTAPMVFDEDNLVVETGSDWAESSTSVVLRPSDGNECFTEGVTYNILVYPGAHSSFSVTLNYKGYGDYTKSLKQAPTLRPAKYYTIGFTSDSELIITEIQKDLTGIETNLPSLDQLEEDVASLLNQVQSVSLMTEYLDNAAYARYAQMTFSKQKLDVSLDYIVKPESAAEALVEAYAIDSKVLSALLGYGKGAGLEIQSDPLAVKELILREIDGIGKVVTATVDASTLDNKFYEGEWSAAVALQITSGKTDIVSDFANLVPKAGSVITGNNYIPIVPGARVVIPFNYAVSGDDVKYALTVTDSQGVAGTSVNNFDNSKTGNLTVTFADVTSVTPSVTLTLTVGEGENQEVVDYGYTFVDNGDRIVLSTNGDVDYIGGDAVVEVESTLGSGSLVQTGGTGVAFDNVKVFTFDENGDYQQRTANVQYSVMANSLTYYKDVTLIQKAYGTPLSRRYFVGSGNNVKKLQSATNQNIQNHLNIVILGDGYVQKDYAEGGLFERRATSAMENFFGIEPFKSYRDRFDVFMAGYIYDRSQDQGKTPPKGGFVYEGTDNNTLGLDVHTYFDSWWDGTSTAISLAESGKKKVENVVKNDLRLTDGAYYRTVVIMLINTDANAGSTFYPEQNTGSLSGDGYHSFSVACVGANSTGFGGLIKHEAGGHAFGRLADEYITVAEGTTISYNDKITLSDAHSKGFYTNVTTDYNNYSHWKMFTDAGYTSTEVGYYEGAWRGSYGVWRPSATSIMQSTGNTGNFNAVSRYAIWRRIILQAKGIENDTMVDFVSYDQKNR